MVISACSLYNFLPEQTDKLIPHNLLSIVNMHSTTLLISAGSAILLSTSTTFIVQALPYILPMNLKDFVELRTHQFDKFQSISIDGSNLETEYEMLAKFKNLHQNIFGTH